MALQVQSLWPRCLGFSWQQAKVLVELNFPASTRDKMTLVGADTEPGEIA